MVRLIVHIVQRLCMAYEYQSRRHLAVHAGMMMLAWEGIAPVQPQEVASHSSHSRRQWIAAGLGRVGGGRLRLIARMAMTRDGAFLTA